MSVSLITDCEDFCLQQNASFLAEKKRLEIWNDLEYYKN